MRSVALPWQNDTCAAHRTTKAGGDCCMCARACLREPAGQWKRRLSMYVHVLFAVGTFGLPGARWRGWVGRQKTALYSRSAGFEACVGPRRAPGYVSETRHATLKEPSGRVRGEDRGTKDETNESTCVRQPQRYAGPNNNKGTAAAAAATTTKCHPVYAHLYCLKSPDPDPYLILELLRGMLLGVRQEAVVDVDSQAVLEVGRQAKHNIPRPATNLDGEAPVVVTTPRKGEYKKKSKHDNVNGPRTDIWKKRGVHADAPTEENILKQRSTPAEYSTVATCAPHCPHINTPGVDYIRDIATSTSHMRWETGVERRFLCRIRKQAFPSRNNGHCYCGICVAQIVLGRT